MLALRSAWVVLIAVGFGCAGTDSGDGRRPLGGGGTTGATGGQGAGGMDETGGAGGFGNNPNTGGVAGGTCEAGCGGTQMMRMRDDDGFTEADGDCNDFSPLVNPGAYDFPGNGIDEDCDGADATGGCDDVDLADTDPLAAARAIELCAQARDDDRRWGVIEARWTTPDGLGTPGSALTYGLLPSLGPAYTPRAGNAMLALSSGVARAPDQIGYTLSCDDQVPGSSKGLPEGFDGTSPACPDATPVSSATDGVALELRLRVPSNVQALRFDSAFFTSEYPLYVCESFNDYFQVLVQPRRTGAVDDNVVFDAQGNAVSVNNALVSVCDPFAVSGRSFDCPLGYDSLVGTGFDVCTTNLCSVLGCDDPRTGASTGWLRTEVPVTPGEILTMRLTTWDSGDSVKDSLALIDHMQFVPIDAPPPPDTPVTEPVDPE